MIFPAIASDAFAVGLNVAGTSVSDFDLASAIVLLLIVFAVIRQHPMAAGALGGALSSRRLPRRSHLSSCSSPFAPCCIGWNLNEGDPNTAEDGSSTFRSFPNAVQGIERWASAR